MGKYWSLNRVHSGYDLLGVIHRSRMIEDDIFAFCCLMALFIAQRNVT